MSKPIIRVEGLSKQYRIGAKEAPYGTLRESIMRAARKPIDWFHRNGKNGDDTIWALKDVSFDVHPGEVVGIIGRNGAGKSTLLKILSRITEPTEGKVDIYGRVGSLLEVGTGFHPELTGRENIYLNGAVLGMKKAEITRKFDEIVAFAEIEKFLDTPVKRYSSGMYVRLAFAVAAHLDPEILLVDEVLAVGDAAFQKKCLGKMGDVAKQGRTVLFVSHNMGAIRSMCGSAVLLDQGILEIRADTAAVVSSYESYDNSFLTNVFTHGTPEHSVKITDVCILRNGEPVDSIKMGDSLAISVSYLTTLPFVFPHVGLVIRNSAGTNIINANNRYQASSFESLSKNEGTVECDLGMLPLMAGDYWVSIWLGHGPEDQHVLRDVCKFGVLESDAWGRGKYPPRGASLLWWPTKFRISKR